MTFYDESHDIPTTLSKIKITIKQRKTPSIITPDAQHQDEVLFADCHYAECCLGQAKSYRHNTHQTTITIKEKRHSA